MASGGTTETVWQALSAWGKTLKPWQRHALVLAIDHRRLTDEDVADLYGEFLRAAGLAEKKPDAEPELAIPEIIADPQSAPVRLDRIDALSGINALPDGSSLTVGPALTVVYGRNGAGKTGFGRLCSNVCFSRNKPAILNDIYSVKASPQSATFHFSLGGQVQPPFTFTGKSEHPELRRLSVFDTSVAQQRVSQSAPLEFKPAGFDVFPEMARVYGELNKRLEADLRAKLPTVNFSASFIGEQTAVSKLVAEISAKTDLAAIRQLAVYGESERARLAEVDHQLTALKGKSSAAAIALCHQAKGDIEQFKSKLQALASSLRAESAQKIRDAAAKAKETREAAAILGSDIFKRPFFKAVGTPEWESFAKAAHLLARREGAEYPSASDHCLLCERPLDDSSREHVAALLRFVEGDAQAEAGKAAAALHREISSLRNVDFVAFAEGTRIREHVARLAPQLETAIANLLVALAACRNQWITASATSSPLDQPPDCAEVLTNLSEIAAQLDTDIARLQSDDPDKAIAVLETERQTLRHREVLSQLLPSIEQHVANAIWCAKSERARSSLNPKPITDKEKDLFSKIISAEYRARLSLECEKLDCVLPIELQTSGQKGETVRALTMKGGHRPNTILSEGEQKAIALADFLTEIGLNTTTAGIILDDPVTSQDHERKGRIAIRLVEEAKARQVVVFTHDLPFLNMLLSQAEKEGVAGVAHWIDRDANGKPGKITLNDAPATSKFYDTSERAKTFLAEAEKTAGSARDTAIRNGMSALRRTLEETVAKRLLKDVTPRWSDRVIVTGLKKIAWDDALADEVIRVYEELSAWIEAHSHTDEASGAPPEVKDLKARIAQVDLLVARCRAERKKAAGAPMPAASKSAAAADKS